MVGPDDDARDYPGVYGEIEVRAGDLIVLESTGGGGWGDPLQRPEAEVLRDVREGFISVASAADDYGVVIENGEVDTAATAAGPRSAMRH